MKKEFDYKDGEPVRDYIGNASRHFVWIEKACPKCGAQLQTVRGTMTDLIEGCPKCDYVLYNKDGYIL